MDNKHNNDNELNTIIEGLKDEMEFAMTERVNQMVKKASKNKFTKDLKEILECGTKDDIYEIAKNLGYTRISSLNKMKLIDKVVEEYPERLSAYLNLIDEPRYKALKYVVSKNGEIKLEDEKYMVGADYFMEIGVLYPVTKGEGAYFIMPEVVQDVISKLNDFQYRATIKRNTELINLFWGMINCYGLLTIEDFIVLLRENYGYENLNETELKEILTAGAKFYETYYINKNIGIHPLIPDVEEMQKSIKKNSKKDSYCKVSKQELLKSAVDDYNLANDAMMKFKTEFKMNWAISEEELSLLLYDLYGVIQIEEPEKVVELLCSDIELDKSEDVIKLEKIIRKTVNNTRLWRLKGKKLSEVNPGLNEELLKKIGRNDPCICGSGKKYKKCCGKKN